jgi:two-component system, NarL family, response regulator NreC
MAHPYNIVLADDHAMFRQGIRSLLEPLEGIDISGEAADGLELLELLKKSIPDLVVLDISMPNLRGLEAAREIRHLYPQVKILLLTMHKKKEFIRQGLEEGVDGFLLKDEPGSELVRAVEAIKKGGKYLSPLLSRILGDLVQETRKAEILSGRERQVLKLLAEGKKTREIAETLFISAFTVRRHRYNIMNKLNIQSLADLVKYAIAHDYLLDSP